MVQLSKRESILNAALQLFVQNGFHGTATSKIAQEANVANGTLFQYFKTKDDLVIALYISIKDELSEFISKNSNSKETIKEVIKAQLLSSLFWALDNQAKFQYIQQIHSSPYIGQIGKDIIDKQAEQHFTILKKGIRQGDIKNLPVELLYALISSQVFGVYQFLITHKLSKARQRETIQTTFDMLWDMIT